VKKKQQAVVVTTQHKGVFFGYAESTDGPTITLTKARMCIYWTADLRGFMGLAVRGPQTGCKIGPAAESMIVRDVTAVVECTPQAVENWEKGIWQ